MRMGIYGRRRFYLRLRLRHRRSQASLMRPVSQNGLPIGAKEEIVKPLSWARVGTVVALVMASSASTQVAAQTAAKATSTSTYAPPRTTDGQPDLQGVWDYRTVTPLERPDEFAGKATITDQEAAEYEKQRTAALDKDRRDVSPQADVGRAYNEFWWTMERKWSAIRHR